MKLTKFGFIAIALGVAVVSQAQVGNVTIRHSHRAATTNTNNPAAVTALQADLAAAESTMTSALPVYDGFRVKSIHAARKALEIVDKVKSGNNATIRPAITTKDSVKSGHAHEKYSSAQMSQSLVQMQRGLALLQQSLQDLRAATNNNPGKKGIEVSEYINRAIGNAQTAIAYHSNGTFNVKKLGQ